MRSKLFLIIALIAVTAVSSGQQNDAWENWNWLVGTWIGEGGGESGNGGGTFTFSRDGESFMTYMEGLSKRRNTPPC